MSAKVWRLWTWNGSECVSDNASHRLLSLFWIWHLLKNVWPLEQIHTTRTQTACLIYPYATSQIQVCVTCYIKLDWHQVPHSSFMGAFLGLKHRGDMSTVEWCRKVAGLPIWSPRLLDTQYLKQKCFQWLYDMVLFVNMTPVLVWSWHSDPRIQNMPQSSQTIHSFISVNFKFNRIPQITQLLGQFLVCIYPDLLHFV